MINKFIKKIRSYFTKKDKVDVGCRTCEHLDLSMNDEPCFSCKAWYTNWKQGAFDKQEDDDLY